MANERAKSKEQVYDAEISPLMERIIGICKAHKISLLADFGLEDSADDDLHCTSALLDDNYRPSEGQLKAFQYLRPRRPVTIAETTETKPDGSKHITMRFL